MNGIMQMHRAEGEDIYYTPQALAQRWGCSKDIIYDLLAKGKLKGFKLGRDWRITDAARRAYEEDPENSSRQLYRPRQGRKNLPLRVV